MIEIKIPDEYVQLCKDWHGGSSSIMYAVASTGGLTLGGIRPYRHDPEYGRYMTDEEWHWDLWWNLGREARNAVKSASLTANKDMYALNQFARYAESVNGQLAVEYELDVEFFD